MLEFDKEIFSRHRAKAITKVEDLEIGKTYYSNSYPSDFILLALCTHAEHYKASGLDRPECDGSLRWFRHLDVSDGFEFWASLHDRNIGASYNPWLIFASREDRDACKAELQVFICGREFS